MAAYISIPRDLTRVKTKVFFGLTKRQLVCFGAAALIGVPVPVCPPPPHRDEKRSSVCGIFF